MQLIGFQMATTDVKTKDFLKKIDLLTSKGVIKNDSQVVKDLTWNKSVMSSVRNGALPVPQHIYNKFKEVYATQIEELIERVAPDPYREKYIALLERQLEEKNTTIKAMEHKISNYLSSETLEAYLQANNALAGTLLDELLAHRATMEKKKLNQLIEASDTRYDARLTALRSKRNSVS